MIDSQKQAAQTFAGSDTVREINVLHADIKALHTDHNEIEHTALSKAIRIGQLLTENRAAVQHGDWLKWIKKNLEFDRTTAFRYIRIFERREELKCCSVQHLTKAYALLATKTDRARDDISQRTPIDDFGGETTPVAAAVDGEVGGIISETAAKRSGRYRGNGDLWDDKPKLAHPTHNKIYNPNGGQMPDVAANVLHHHGVIREPSVLEMNAEIERESQSSRTIAKEQRAQAALAAVAEKVAEIEALPEVESFCQFLATRSKRDAKAIVAVLAVRWGIIEAAREQRAVAPTDSDSKQIVAEPEQKRKTVPSDEEAIWRRGLLDRAQAAVNGAAYQDWWVKYTFDDEVIDAATQAAEAWQNLVTFLNRNPF